MRRTELVFFFDARSRCTVVHVELQSVEEYDRAVPSHLEDRIVCGMPE